MARSRSTSGHSDCPPSTDAAAFQPPGRNEVRHGGRRIPGRIRFRAAPAEAVRGQAADPNQAHEQGGHERGSGVRPLDLWST